MDNKVKILIFIFITLLTISSLSHLTQNAFAESNYQDDEDVEATLHSTLVSDSSEIHSSLMPIGSYSFFETPELDVGSFSHDLTMIDVAKLQFPEFNATTSQSYSFVEGVNATQGNHTIYFNQELPEYTTSGGFDTIIYLNFNYSSSDYQIDTIFYDDFSSYGYWDLYNVSNRIFVSNDYPTGDAMVASNNPDHPYGGWYCLTVDSSGYWSYFSYVSDYLDANFSASLPNTKFYLTKESAPTGMTHSIYQTSKFYESNITWNNKPAVGDLISSEFISGGAGSKWLLDLETSIRYYYYVFKTTGGQLRWYAKDGNPANKKPLVHQYFYKNYQNDSLIYMQTNETETLSLISPDYGDIKLVNRDNITIQCQSTSDHQLNLELLNAGTVIKTLEVIPEGNTEFGNQTIQFMVNDSLIFDQLKFTGVFDNKEYFKCYDINITGYRRQNFEHVYVEDFNYTVLGITYNDTIELSFDDYKSNYYGVSNGTYFYYFDSSSLTHRQDTDDVLINNQNLTIIIDLLETLEMTLDFTINASYSTTSWRVPTEVSLTINSQSVIDSTYNSGYVYLSTFPTTLSITADSNVFFELNITSYFTFTFDLEIISKTYLRKTFKLLSDHSIYIDTIALDSDLDIKKIYLNNDDLGSSNPNHLNPSVQMDTDNIFNLEIILADVLYRNLPYDTSRELYNEDWSSWDLGYDSDDTISSYNDGNLSSQLQAGHYPGTYSFKDEVGETDLDISFVDYRSVYTHSIVIDELYSHHDVMKMYNSDPWDSLYNQFDYKTSGTVEFWVLSNYTSHRNIIRLTEGSVPNIEVGFFANQIFYRDVGADTRTYLCGASTNTWYHFKINFTKTIDHTYYSFYINGIRYLNHQQATYDINVGINRLDLSFQTSYIMYMCFDGIGYSWDSNYKIGDNMYYENYMGTHDFENYDLSTNENYFGEHGFDLETEVGFYKGSAGFNYETVNHTEFYFGSPDNFNDEDIGDEGIDEIDWIVHDIGSSPTSKIVEEVDNHKNILYHENGKAKHEFTQTTSGTWEFWVHCPDKTDNVGMEFTEGLYDARIQLKYGWSNFQYHNGTDYIIVKALNSNQWYHQKIVLYSDNTFDWYIDGVKEVDKGKTQADMVSGVNYVGLYSQGVGHILNFDAWGNIDDPSYSVGKNRFPGNSGTDLDWIDSVAGGDGNQLAVIVDEEDGHKNALKMTCDGNTGTYFMVGHYMHDTDVDNTLEFWAKYIDNGIGNIDFRIHREDGQILIRLWFSSTANRLYWNYGNGVGGSSTGNMIATADIWYHIKVEYSCTNDDYSLWVDGVMKLDTENFYYDRTANDITTLLIYLTEGAGANTIEGYIDAPGIISETDPEGYVYELSWDINPYNIDKLLDAGYDLSCAFGGSHIKITDSVEGHKNILEFYDNQGNIDYGDQLYTIIPFTSSSNGIIEFWMRTNDTSYEHKIYLRELGYTRFIFMIDEDKFRYYNGSWNDIGLGASDNTWYHIRIVFECGAGGYEGLSPDHWKVFINGTEYGDYIFSNVGANLDSIGFLTTAIDNGYIWYIDALDFSWSPDYVSYRNTNQFYEDLRDTKFVDDWTITYAYNCWVNISGEYGQHKKYVELYDDNNGESIYIYDTFSQQTSGTIEFYIKTDNTNEKSQICLIGSTTHTWFYLQTDKFQYYDGTVKDIPNVGTPSNDQWHHIVINFETGNGGYKGLGNDKIEYIIDGVSSGELDFAFSSTYIDKIHIYSDCNNVEYTTLYDAISYSWEDGVGINLLKEVSEIDNPYATINKTISGDDFELYSYTVVISFTYKFTQYGAYLNTTKMNDVELIDDNAYHIYSAIITTSQHSFFYTFNISNGILLLSDFNFVIENQHSIQKTINPITTIDSVEFKEYLQADRTFEYWYYRNIYTINDLEIEHDPSSTITSSFGYENHKYYFSQYANTDDEFTGTIDYNPNWQISFTFIVNNATYSKVKVNYGADFVIYNTTLVLDLRNSGIFDDIENPNRDNYILNIDSLSFSSTTQSLYIIGNRTQQTPNPQTDVDLVQLNEEFTYNSQVLSSSYVSVNPNWQISTSVIDKNGTYGKLEIDFKADLPLINVDLKTSVKRNNMFSDVVETKDYQNDTSIYFQLDGLSFTTDYQSTYVEGFRTLLESDITTDDIYLDYNEEYKWSSTSLSNYTVGLCPCWLVSTSVLENNGTYGKVQVDFKADLSLINVDLKFSIDRNNIFGDSVEIIGYQNTTEINFILENINFTTSLQSEVVEGFRTLLESDITTDDIYLDYNEEYKWSSISLSNYSIEIKPNWDVSFSYVYNNASYSYIQSDYSSDLDFYNVTMNLDLRNTAIFDDMDNQGKDDYLLTIEYLNFTTSTKTLYITGTRTQYTSNPQTDINIIQLNETIIYNNDVLTTSLVDNDPNWQISISVIQKNATYGKLEIEYKSDATYTNVDLKTSITRNNMFDDSVEVKGYQNETTLSFELSVITFNSSFQITYIEGFRYLDEIDIHTNMSYVDYEERYYWSSVSLNNYSIEINPNWVILSSIVEYNGTYSKIKIQCKSDIAINNVTLQFSRSRNSIFGDIYELAGYQNITKIEFNLQNVNFTSLYQTTYIECFRSLTQINPNTNMTYLDFEEQYYWNSTSLSNHSIRINPNWNVGYSIISNNGTFAQLNISYYSDLFISDILLKLSLRYDDLYAENWSNNAQQSIYTYILEIPDINFTTSEQILNLTGVSSVPYCNFSSFINEDGFKLSDEEWRIKITDEEWRTITKSNWEDIEVYMYGYVQFTKYSRVFIISDMEDDWELDGVHYQGIPYDISATGYFTCEGWGSGITSAYLRFKTNPIEDLRREQTREQVIYKIKSKYDLEDVDFIFYIEEDERYNINDMIKQLKKEIDCTDIIKYYSVEDRDYYMIMDMDLDEGTNKITIYYKIENAAKYSWAFLIVGIAMIGFSIIYISYRYYDNKILDFIGLDKLVKYFFWIKKSERIKMTKKYRLNKKKKKRGKK